MTNKGEPITNMMQFQKRYFPKDVGKKCPCCSRDYITGLRDKRWKIVKEVTEYEPG